MEYVYNDILYLSRSRYILFEKIIYEKYDQNTCPEKINKIICKWRKTLQILMVIIVYKIDKLFDHVS